MAVPAQKRALADELLQSERDGLGRWAQEARSKAQTRFLEMGAPHGRDEYWKYTAPSLFLGDQKQPFDAPQTSLDHLERYVFTFVDGYFSQELSDNADIDGVNISFLSKALEADIHAASGLYGSLEAQSHEAVQRPLAALNTARATDGLVLIVSETPSKPIEIRYIQKDTSIKPILHHVISVAKGQSLIVLENGYAGHGSNIEIETKIADTAHLHHIRFQDDVREATRYTSLFAELGASSVLKSFTLGINGQATRNESVITLNGDYGSAHIATAYAGGHKAHHDDTVFITHDAEHCESRQVFKKVLDGRSTSVFQGKILVKEGAQKTDGYQISQGLLLDETSQFLAKPELEIYADDVACSHGSTCGAVDERALFYMKSRGIPDDQAKDLLVLAFLDDAIQEISDEGIANLVRDRLQSKLALIKG